MLLKIWLNVFSTEKGATCPRDRLNRTARDDDGDGRPRRRGGHSGQGPAGGGRGLGALQTAGRGREAEPGRGPRPGIAPRKPPASPGGLGVNGGVRLAAEGTRGVGYGAI